MKNIILYSVLAGAIVFPAQGTIASERSGGINTPPEMRVHNDSSIIKVLDKSIEEIQNVNDSNEAIEHIKKRLKDVIDKTLPEERGKLLNEKNSSGNSILCIVNNYYDGQCYTEDIIDYIKDCFCKTPEGETYLKLEEAIKTYNYDRCRAILEKVSVNVDQLYTVLTFGDEDDQTLLMRGFEQLRKAANKIDKSKASRIIHGFLQSFSKIPKELLLNILSMEDFSESNILIQATGTGDMSLTRIIKEMLPESKLLDVAMPYVAGKHIYHNVLGYAVTSGNRNGNGSRLASLALCEKNLG